MKTWKVDNCYFDWLLDGEYMVYFVTPVWATDHDNTTNPTV